MCARVSPGHAETCIVASRCYNLPKYKTDPDSASTHLGNAFIFGTQNPQGVRDLFQQAYKRRILILSVLVFIVTAYPRIQSTPRGLPYMQFWDEPLLATGAINALKRDNIFPQQAENIYGGFLRYTCVAVNAVYLQYIKWTDPSVKYAKDIKTDMDGLTLTVSHSGFYKWMRIWVAVLNSLSFVFVFLTVRIRGGTVLGLFAVLVLASVWPYYDVASLARTSLPMATFSAATVYFGVRYNHSKNLKDLLICLMVVGLAVSTKMTGLSLIGVPIIAAWVNYAHLKRATRRKTVRRFAKLAAIPVVVFLLINPHVYLNPEPYFHWMMEGSRVYKAGGQGHLSRERGLEHLGFQIGEFTRHLSKPVVIATGVGILSLLIAVVQYFRKREDGITDILIVGLFPLAYLVYVSFTYSIAFHRTFFLLYPLWSILAAEGALLVTRGISRFVQGNMTLQVVPITFVIVSLIYFWPNYQRISRAAKARSVEVDTRTAAIQNITEKQKQGPIHLGIAHGLHISPEDLHAIKGQYGFFDHLELDSARRGFTHLLIPEFDYGAVDLDTLSADERADYLTVRDRHIEKVTKGYALKYYHARAPWEPQPNPTIYLVSGSEYPPPRLEDYQYPVHHLQYLPVVDHIPREFFYGALDAGRYTLEFKVAGQPALGEDPILALHVLGNDVDSLVASSKDWKEHRMHFTLQDAFVGTLFFRLPNDYWNPETLEDRNVWIQDLQMWKDN